MVTRRILPTDEVHKAIAAGGPLQELQLSPSKLKTMTIGVVESDGAIVAYWVAFFALHAEPLWVRPDHRHSPRVIGHVVEIMREIVEASEEPAAFVQIDHDNTDLIAPYAYRLGFEAAPGSLYYMVLPERQEKES